MRLPLERMHDWCRRSASPVPATAKRLPLSSQMHWQQFMQIRRQQMVSRNCVQT